MGRKSEDDKEKKLSRAVSNQQRYYSNGRGDSGSGERGNESKKGKSPAKFESRREEKSISSSSLGKTPFGGGDNAGANAEDQPLLFVEE